MGYPPGNDGFQQLNMCGIASILLHPQDRTVDEWQSIRSAFTLNLMMNEQRGSAATGVAVIEASGKAIVYKRDQPASWFVQTPEYIRIIRRVGSRTTLILGHTRLPTQGDASRAVNNHPIQAGSVVGVHNGEITNAENLFAESDYPRDGEVDSEIIFRLMEKADPTVHDRPYLDDLQCRIQALEGKYTFLACDKRKPEQIVAVKHGNPLCVHFHEPWNALIFSSRHVFLRKVFKRSFKAGSLPPDSLMLFDAMQLPAHRCSPEVSVPLFG